MPLRKRRYGLDTRQLSIRLADDTYRRLYALVPSGRHSAFVDAATQAALARLEAQRGFVVRRNGATTRQEPEKRGGRSETTDSTPQG